MHPATTGTGSDSTRTAVIVGGIDLLITLGALLAANSAVILADFCKTLLEFVAVMLAWLTLCRTRRGQDQDFNYGVGKLENLSSLLIGLLMFLCLGVISVHAVHALIYPVHISGAGIWLSLVAQAVYAAINSRLALQSRAIARAERSPLHETQAGLFFTKALGNGFIFLSLSLSALLSAYKWSLFIDPLASLIIAASILFAAIGIFKNSVLDLLDRTLEESHQIAILRSLANHFEQYRELRELRSRRSGRQVFVEIVLGFDPDQTAAQIEVTARELKLELEREIPGSRITIAVA